MPKYLNCKIKFHIFFFFFRLCKVLTRNAQARCLALLLLRHHPFLATTRHCKFYSFVEAKLKTLLQCYLFKRLSANNENEKQPLFFSFS